MRFVKKDIREEWSRIKDSLTKTLHPSDSLEELYHKCRNEQAFLFVVPEGYIIVDEFNDDDGQKVLFLWVVYGEGKNLIIEYEKDIDELAHMIGATKIAFRTLRKGFEKVLSDKWYVEHIEYRKRVA
ncbi:MAG: hypothetical protein ACREAE_09505 [Nitrosopumilaceae archaeon]